MNTTVPLIPMQCCAVRIGEPGQLFSPEDYVAMLQAIRVGSFETGIDGLAIISEMLDYLLDEPLIGVCDKQGPVPGRNRVIPEPALAFLLAALEQAKAGGFHFAYFDRASTYFGPGTSFEGSPAQRLKDLGLWASKCDEAFSRVVTFCSPNDYERLIRQVNQSLYSTRRSDHPT